MQSFSRVVLIMLTAFSNPLSASDTAEHSIIYSGGLWLGIPVFPSGFTDRRHDGDGNTEVRLAYRYHDGSADELEFAYSRGISWWSADTDYTVLSASLVRAWPASSSNQLFMRVGFNGHHLAYAPSTEEGPSLQTEVRDSLGLQGAVGWRYRTGWGELGVDLNMTHMHPVRVRHAHFNIGYRF